MAGDNVVKQVQMPNGIELSLNRGHMTGKRWIEYKDSKRWRVVLDYGPDREEFIALYEEIMKEEVTE
jgi:hypothetical protein